MAVKINGTDVSNFMVNGVAVSKVMQNGVEVWSPAPTGGEANLYMHFVGSDYDDTAYTWACRVTGNLITYDTAVKPVKNGDYVTFNGEETADYIDVGDNIVTGTGGAMYTEFMIPSDQGGKTELALSSNPWLVFITSDDLDWRSAMSTEMEIERGCITFGTWHKLLITETNNGDSTTTKTLYIDGTQLHQETDPIDNSSQIFNLWAIGYSARPFIGNIKDLRFYNAPKLPADIVPLPAPSVTFEADILGTTDTNITVTMEGCSTYYINDVEYTYSGPFSMLLHWSDIKTLKTYDNVTRVAFANDFIQTINVKTMTSVTSMFEMFKNLWNITSLTLPDLGSVTNFNSAFWGLGQITSFGVLNTVSGTDFENMFYNMDGLLTIGGINTINQTSTTNMFFGCTALTSPNASEQSTIEAGANWTP